MTLHDTVVVAVAACGVALAGLSAGCRAPSRNEGTQAQQVGTAGQSESGSQPAVNEKAAEAAASALQNLPPVEHLVTPLKGKAEIGYLVPHSRVEGGTVVTTIKVKNLSKEPIAGLKVEEFWWDRAGNPVTGNQEILRKPLMPGETATMELKTPKAPGMYQNNYRFSHAYGLVDAKEEKSLG